ncbi:hypothetical protein [Streptomyces mexicanus]|uniref:Uncharacterized protein n=1 Tax=Streptomyces mexicanus TaxID=178566 RepID=A0A7X1I4B0_9ACTN|nr:hypothetical protein [Streptomyces mexicanus]MBC2868549.1 hypothetical protein [Streptomyces mexicanus]
MTDLHDRAAAVLGTEEGRVRWPYGMSPIHPSEKRKDPERYEQRRAQRLAGQEAMVSWAEHYGLKYSEAGCCPFWLQGKTSRRCRPYGPHANRCTRYGTHVDQDWLDHAVGWLKGGRPAVLTSAPYGLEYITEAPERLAYWQQEDPRLQVVQGTGWYGHGTTQIVMWRTDILDEVAPA